MLPRNLEQLCKKAKIPGLSIATVSGGKTINALSLGTSDIESKSAVNNDSVFWACSLSKPLFAYLVVQRHE